MAGKKRVTQAAADELVKRYIIDKVKAQATVDQELFDSVLALHELAEERESDGSSAKRLGELRDSPMVRAAMAVLGQRFQRLADIGVRIANDTQALRVELRQRLEAAGVDPSDPKQAAAADAEYERTLAATIPVGVALENVGGLADMVELANARFALARVIDDPVRARALAEQAREPLRQRGGPEADALEKWLAAAPK